MALNPLNHHYSMENPASVYDEEALTALKLAARTTAKVNETVAAFNELEQNTNEHLTDQDNAIEKMNTEAMPAEVKAEFQRNLDDKTFDKMIDDYSRELSSRVDHLLGKVQEGSTSGDAELIDARLDIFGGEWDTAGNAIRGQAHKLNDMMAPLVGDKKVQLNVTLSNGWYNNSGVFVANTSSTKHSCTSIDVKAGETYYIYSRYGYSMADAMTVDASGAVVQIFHTDTGEAINNLDKPIHISGKAAKLYVNYMSGQSLRVYKVSEYTFNQTAIWDTLSNMFNALIDEDPVLGDPLAITIDPATCIYEGRVIAVQDGNTKFRTASIPVNCGEVYHAHMTCGLAMNFYYYIFDSEGNVLEGVQAASEGATAYDHTFLIPPNAATLVISGYQEDPVIYPVNGYKTSGGENLSSLKWVCLGDSLTEVNSRATKRYHDYIADQTGVRVVNMGVSGTGYRARQSENKAFYQRIASMPSDADLVTIFGSGNDGESVIAGKLGDITDTGTDTLCGCINKTIDTIYGIKPTVQLGIIAPTPWINNTPSDNGSMVQICEKLEAICKRRGIPYLDLFHGSGLRPNDAAFRSAAYSKDEGNGVHPDENGHKMIASHILSFVQSMLGAY